ncbi:uncharacterized protein LOC135372635 [Ornithodoros turicata]|uniref:uncharacterized protein LOC135372635 n=1 Tax=Ornithodoros turicata TaxID=34597 RepID=UPI0031388663
MPPRQRRLKQYLHRDVEFKVPRQTRYYRRNRMGRVDSEGGEQHILSTHSTSTTECVPRGRESLQDVAGVQHLEASSDTYQLLCAGSTNEEYPEDSVNSPCFRTSGDSTEVVGEHNSEVPTSVTAQEHHPEIGSPSSCFEHDTVHVTDDESDAMPTVTPDNEEDACNSEMEDILLLLSESEEEDAGSPSNAHQRHVHSSNTSESMDEDPEDQLPSGTLPGTQTTVAAAIIMIMAFVVGHGLSWVALQDLLTIINTLFGTTVVPPTLYLFRKLWCKKNASLVTYHYYCESCEALLNSQFRCDTCRKTYNQKQLRASGCFFVIAKIAKQIKHHIELSKTELVTNLLKLSSELQLGNDITDITSAAAHRKLRDNGTLKSTDLTITFNTDGSPLYKSSKTSIWPIQFTINELPPKSRFKNPILAGLWFGKTHPNMTLFLNEFVDELNNMEPVTWTCNTETYTSRVYALCCCVDAPARAAVQNFVLFNGYFGCPWCLTKGKYTQGSMRYLCDDRGAERTADGVARDMGLALQFKTTVNGVKGPSALLNLHAFDSVWGYTVDYMHCVLQGVARQFAELWFASCHSEEQFYIGNPAVLSTVERRLLSIKPPHCFTRLPRTITERAFWKASEWRLWVLFYSLPCTHGILPERYWRHFAKLSHALHILLAEKITHQMIHKAEHLLEQFVSRAAALYGEGCMRFNVHQLLHLPKAARLMGPLWAHSAFVFESGNGTLVKLVTASKGIPLQIVERVALSQKLYMHLAANMLTSRTKALCMRMLGEKRLQSATYVGNVCMLDKEKATCLTAAEKAEIAKVCGSCPDVASEFKRVVYNDQVYHSTAYARAVKSNSSAIRTVEGEYYVVSRIIAVNTSSGRKCVLLCKEIITVHSAFPDHIRECFIDPVPSVLVVDMLRVQKPCVLINFAFEEKTFVCDLPNVIERD